MTTIESMAKTFKQLQQEIAQLQKQAAEMQVAEVQGVVSKIKAAIREYGLTVEDLFGTKGKGEKKPKAATSDGAGKKPGGVIKYKDGKGNQWTGHGKRPRWILEALESGRTMDDMKV